ncbi:MAG: hypothetical protein DRP11_01720 [Candidatus Aenigmatarchaeota archaeon]|nr:MAG: hypothetical protein DRP11_01720 [Candidatus Aenigmarchaeota archaeon]
MKVAVFSDTYEPQVNGVVNCINMLNNEFRKDGIETMIVAPTGTGNKFTSLTLPFYKEFEVAPLPYHKSLKLLKGFKPDIIHSHTQFNMGVAALMARKVLKVPVVTTFHTLIPDYFGYYFFESEVVKELLWKYFVKYFKHCDAITTPNQEIKDEIRKRLNREVYLIRNGVDVNKFHPKRRSRIYESYGIKDEKVVLHVGRLSKERSLDELIEAFKDILNERDDVRLVIVGRGPAERKLKRMARGYRDKIIFTGFVSDEVLPQIYASAYLFVTPSKTDVYPLALLEAYASGLPVVGSEMGGVGHLINKKTGFKFSSTGEMKERIIHLLDDENVRKKLSGNARKFAETKSWEHVSKEFVDLYERTIEGFNESQYIQ